MAAVRAYNRNLFVIILLLVLQEEIKKVLPAYLPTYISSHPETKKVNITINSKRKKNFTSTHTHVKGTKGPLNIFTILNGR